MTFPLLTRSYQPYGDLMALRDEMSRLFESAFGQPLRGALAGGDYVPAIDVLRDKDAVTIKADLPGMKREDIEVTVLNGHLAIRGEKKQETESTDAQRVERFYGSFERVIDLPFPVDVETIRATFRDGVLEVRCPLREEAKPRQIAVDVK